MVAIFSHHDVGQQTRRGEAAIQKPFRQGRHEGRKIRVGPVNMLPGEPPGVSEKPAWLVIQLPADLLPDQPPLFRLRLDRCRVECLLDHRQVLGQTREPFLADGRGSLR